MAKKQPKEKTSGESKGLGLILTLIFFIITTLILGTLTYFGYAEQEALAKATKDAQDQAREANRFREEERARVLTLRIAMGTNNEEDLQDMAGLVGVHTNIIQQEYQNIRTQLRNGLPEGEFVWNLAGNQPATQPQKTLPQLVAEYHTAKENALAAQSDAETALAQAQDSLKTARDDAVANKQKFDQELATLNQKYDQMRQDNADSFKQAIADKVALGDKVQEVTRQAKRDVESKDKELRNLVQETDRLRQRVENYQLKESPPEVDLNKPRGRIERRENDLVYINIGRNDQVRPQLTFSVFPSRREVLGAATGRNDVRVDLTGRVSVADNGSEHSLPRDLKGAIEIIEVIGPTQSIARVTYELDQIRDPIRTGDELFNPAWTPGVKEHIAFAGIIDLDGDGVDDNEEFIRILERQGVVVDAYLDLKTRTIRGEGIDLNTSYLVLSAPPRETGDLALPGSTETPQQQFRNEVYAKLALMQKQADELGVQVMSARKFLAYIGVEMPRNPAPPNYSAGQYLRGISAPERENDGLPDLPRLGQ